MAASEITTVKLSMTTRDRLLQTARDDFGGISMDKAVDMLLDEHWKATYIAQADKLREEDPAAWQEILDENETWDRASPNITEMEGPYRCDDPHWLETGGLPLTTSQKDAA